jgi:hypothetical protein
VQRDETTISRVRACLRGLLPEGEEVIEKNGYGGYRLNPSVVIERIDWEALARHPDPEVQKLAKSAIRGH